MRIKKIEIKNFKAFYKEHTIQVDGKNLFIYGENGSGKSSLYYALKDFFQSSRETIDFNELENIFLTKAERGKGYVRVTFNPNKDGVASDTAYEFGATTNTTYTAADTSIRDAIGLKSFLTYKHLLGIHNVKRGNQIDLFNLLVKGVLKHFKSAAITGTKELGELWKDVEDVCAKEVGSSRGFNAAQKRKDLEAALKLFNDAFRELFRERSPEYILNIAQPILDEFNYNIKIKLNYTEARPNTDNSGVVNNYVRIKLKYLDKAIEEPHLFLNEARLSAIAISIYLGMVKRHIQGNPLKVLFLDDIFIGLDISNRLPLMEILKKYFISPPAAADYQIFITTYDKPWYEFMKFYLNDDAKWRTVELYSKRARKGFEIPVIKPQTGPNFIQNMIDTAQAYFNAAENKAAGVYLRAAFEFMLKKYCCNDRPKRRLPVSYEIDSSKLTSENFWQAVIKFKADQPANCGLTPATQARIEHFRKLVLNPLSHHDINKHEIRTEINSAITTIQTLKAELGV